MREDKPVTKSETAGDKAGHKATAQAEAPAMKPGWRCYVHSVAEARWPKVKRSSWVMGRLGSQVYLVMTMKVFWFPQVLRTTVMYFLVFQQNQSLQKYTASL